MLTFIEGIFRRHEPRTKARSAADTHTLTDLPRAALKILEMTLEQLATRCSLELMELDLCRDAPYGSIVQQDLWRIRLFR